MKAKLFINDSEWKTIEQEDISSYIDTAFTLDGQVIRFTFGFSKNEGGEVFRYDLYFIDIAGEKRSFK